MIWHLVALVFAGLGAASIGFLLRSLSGKKLPGWIVPAFAGLGMLGYQIYYEYSWAEHKQSQLPAGSAVVEYEVEQQILRPWTYLMPMTVGFSVVDTGNIQSAEQDGQRIKQFILYRFEKEYVDRLTHQTYLLNCDSAEMVSVSENNPRLRQLERSDELYRVVCR
ncbi:hypothetical protein VUJ49_07720 [Pseudomonas berkeleyensis]|uniref:Uncharacterized protein n=1 Tax=Pseudomonas berkeleyensis TaxID=2726956 RepID=A0A7G5DT58_9PSED|nr:hypothetical protein [Pseudomonas berkeleyensis]QMV64933.1 hypothetical protein HS968_07685 [Pseudomonas berkeleyensis]WSO40400.1 hypothetical protein VUJ49_07720 [Pseudomonas berkeleyensis]